MRMKNIVVATFMTLGFASATFAANDINSGKVSFTGTVLDTPCDLKAGQNGADIKVPFNQLSKSQLNAKKTAIEKFSIELTNCDLTGKTTSIKFSSPSQDASGEFLSTQIPNLGIKLELADLGGEITLGEEKNLTGLNTNGENLLEFNAIAYRTSTGDTELVAEGDFSALSTFEIIYK